MARTVEARLNLVIQDDTLAPHVAKVKEAREEWQALNAAFGALMGGDFKSLAGALSGMAPELKKVADSAKGLGSLGKFAQAIADVASPLLTVNTRLGPFAEAAEKAGPAIEKLAIDTSKWAKSIQTLSAVLNTLTDRMESLTKAQQQVDQNLNNFGLGLSAANKLMKEQGQDMLRVLQAYAGFNKAVQQGTKAVQAQDKAGRGFLDTLKFIERAYIRHSTVIFIAQHQMEAMIDTFVEAGQKADLDVVLNRSLKNFQQTMEDTREATNGMVTDLQIMKSAALMSSFKIPMENFASNMEMIQKLAVRTGQSTEFLMDSFARGVSRLSPAILDNLGLQISLTEAYGAYAASVGKATSELDAQEKKTAVLNEVLRQASELTTEVDPTATLSARLEQARATIGNFFSDMKVSILDFFATISAEDKELAATGSAFLDVFIKQMKEAKFVSEDQAGRFRDYVLALSDGARMAAADLYGDSGFWTELNRAMAANDPLVELTVEGVEKLRKTFSQYAQVSDIAGRQTEKYQESLVRIQELSEALSRAPEGSGQAQLIQRQIDEARSVADFQRQYLVDLSTTLQRLDEMKKKAADVAKGMFPDSSQLQAAFTNQILKAVEDTKMGIASGARTGFFFDVLLPPGWETNLKTFAQKATETSGALARKANEAIKERLSLLDREIVQMQHLVGEGKGITSIEIDLLNLRKQSAQALSEYTKQKEALDKNEGEANEAGVRAAGEKLKLLLEQQRVLEGKVRLEKEFTDALTSTAGLSKGLKEDMAQQLADGKTRNQLEREFLQLRIDLGKATADLAVAQVNFGLAVAKGQQAEIANALFDKLQAEQALEDLKKEIVARREAISRFGAGGGKGNKPDAPKTPEDLKDTDEFSYLKERLEAGGIALDVFNVKATWTFDSVTGALKTTNREVEILSGFLENQAPADGIIKMTWFGGGAETSTIKSMEAAIALNEDQLKAIDQLRDKLGQIGPLTKQREQQLKDTNDKLREQIKLTKELADTYRTLGSAISSAFAGGQGLLGEDFLNITKGLAEASNLAAAALESEAVAYGLVGAASAGVRAFSKELIDSKRKQATVEMLMQTAAAWAAAATPGMWPAAIAHGTAAVIYGLVSGGVLKLPTKASKTDKDSAEREVKASSPINVYLYGTEFITSEGQMGRRIEDGVAQARAQGRI